MCCLLLLFVDCDMVVVVEARVFVGCVLFACFLFSVLFRCALLLLVGW